MLMHEKTKMGDVQQNIPVRCAPPRDTGRMGPWPENLRSHPSCHHVSENGRLTRQVWLEASPPFTRRQAEPCTPKLMKEPPLGDLGQGAEPGGSE